VAEICRRLDGMPLALELAAARVRVLSLGQIAARLDDRFGLLTGGSRTALPRQQTLQATMEWSYDLLSASERALLRRLSVFAGGFTLDAVAAVAADADVLDLLTRLVDKSLVSAEEHDGAVRYRLLETVRQYAAEQLSDASEGAAAHERHAAWYLQLAEEAWQYCRGSEQGAWLQRLSIEDGNLRAALGWCLADEDRTTLGLRLAGRLSWFWEMRGALAEGRRWLAALLGRGAAAPADVQSTALYAAGVLALDQGDYAVAVHLHEQSLALAREFGDEAAIARSLNSLAVTTGTRGDHTYARALLEENLAVQRTLGDRWMIAGTLANLGNVVSAQGEPERAVALYEESLALSRELGDRRLVAILLQNLGNRYREMRAWDRAAARYHEGLAVFREVQDQLGIVRCLRVIAGLSIDRGDPVRAARLGGAAAAMREALGVAFSARGDAAFERSRAAACAALGEADFAAAWAAGQALSQEHAIAEALAATGDAA
jgi:non-specific serine/threonine protein kinase